MTGPDPYVSRVGSRWEIAERLEPVVWTSDRPGPLSRTQLDQFDQLGFVVLPSWFTGDEVATVLAETERMAASADRTRDDVIVEPDSDVVRSLFRIHRDSEICARVLADPRLVGAARQILGDDVYLHQSRVNFKAAFEGKAFPWHSDFETWHVEDGMPRMRALSASLLLTTNTEHNGPLLVIPRSHRRYVRCVGETPPEHFRQSLRKQAYGVPAPEALTQLAREAGYASCVGPPGTVVLFDCNLMHGSAGNISHLPRHNIFAVFNASSNRLVAPFGGMPARPAFLAERDDAPIIG